MVPPASNGGNTNVQRREEVRSQIIDSGVPSVQIGNTQVPFFGGGQSFVWSLFSLLLMVGSVITAVVIAAKMLVTRKNGAGLENRVFEFISIAVGFISLLSFFILYNLSGVMVLVDAKTIFFVFLLLGELAALVIAKIKAKPTNKI